MRLSCEVQSLARHFHLGAVRSAGNFSQLVAVEAAALEVHRGVGSSRILAKHLIEQDQGLEYDLPGGLGYLAQAADAHSDVMALAGLRINRLAAARGNLLQERQLQRRSDGPDFAKIQYRVLLKALAERSERLVGELIPCGIEKILSQSEGSRNDLTFRSTDMRQSSVRFDLGDYTGDLGKNQGEVVAEPAQILGGRLPEFFFH